jgi:hypothetical protein
MLRRVRTLYLNLNMKTPGIVTISLLSAWVRLQAEHSAGFPMAVVLPIVFSIGAAYQCREEAP